MRGLTTGQPVTRHRVTSGYLEQSDQYLVTRGQSDDGITRGQSDDGIST